MNVTQICQKKKKKASSLFVAEISAEKRRKIAEETQTYPSELGLDLGEHLEHRVGWLILHLHQLVQLLGDLDPVDLQGETPTCHPPAWGEDGGGSGSVHSPWTPSRARRERACWCRGCAWAPSRPRRVCPSGGGASKEEKLSPPKNPVNISSQICKINQRKYDRFFFFLISSLAFVFLHASDTPAA